MRIHKEDNETEIQFLWRLGQAKRSGVIDTTWEGIADIMNKEFPHADGRKFGESRYRKMFQAAEKFIADNVINVDSDAEELTKIKHEIQKERQKLSDERVAVNKTLRETARMETDLNYLKSLIQENGRTVFRDCNRVMEQSDNDLLIALSDFHLGADNVSYFGAYNSQIAEQRLQKYLEKIIQIQELHHSENAYVALLGDIINGGIRHTVQLQNRENLIEQIQKSAELISAFIYGLSKHFKNVHINSVSGNHSRTSMNKDEVLRDNRLDTLIPWYIKAKLGHIHNIIFYDNNIDPTISDWWIRDKAYLMVHGDYDSFSERGISKLVMMLGFKPEGIFFGHFHRCSYDEIAGVKIVRSGSFSGTVDDYTITKRLSGSPSQMVCVINNDGIEVCYPVALK